GYPTSFSQIYGNLVVIQFSKLPAHPTVSGASPSVSAAASPSPKPSGSSKAGTSATPSPTPVPSPTSTQQGRGAVIAGLAAAEGVATTDVTVHNLSAVTETDVVSALAQKAGTTASAVQTKEVTGK